MSESLTLRTVEKITELIKEIRVAMLTTTSDGVLRSRPMVTQEDGLDGTLWFLASAGSTMVSELAASARVNVTYAAPANDRYVSASGRASVALDPDRVRGLWSAAHEAWFPKGPDDPDLLLLKVEVEEVEYWEGTSRMVVQLVARTGSPGSGSRRASDREPPVRNRRVPPRFADERGGRKSPARKKSQAADR